MCHVCLTPARAPVADVRTSPSHSYKGLCSIPLVASPLYCPPCSVPLVASHKSGLLWDDMIKKHTKSTHEEHKETPAGRVGVGRWGGRGDVRRVGARWGQGGVLLHGEAEGREQLPQVWQAGNCVSLAMGALCRCSVPVLCGGEQGRPPRRRGLDDAPAPARAPRGAEGRRV
jgi:hypothetical protein